MFAAFAIGAPAGSALYAAYGFTAIAFATAVAPLVTLLVLVLLPFVAGRGERSPSRRPWAVAAVGLSLVAIVTLAAPSVSAQMTGAPSGGYKREAGVSASSMAGASVSA